MKTDPMPSVPPKICLGAKNMEKVLDALVTTENESERAKQENRTRGPLSTAENESESAKRENRTRRPRYRRERFRGAKHENGTPSVHPKMSLGAQNI
jgi:hypothetical protein